jgi:hypothetical protein
MWAGEFYKSAEAHWVQPNTCVEFSFDPPSGTRSLRPNQSAQVRVDLRTKAGELPVPWATSNIGVIGGAGTVSPRSAQASPGAPATLTYTASSQPRGGNGIDLATTSRAGVAAGQWRIRAEGPPQWSGSITVVETFSSASSGQNGDIGAHTTEETETTELKVTVTDGVDESGSDALSSLSGRAEGRFQRLKTYAGWTTGYAGNCGSIKNRRMNNNSRETSSGSGSGDAAISVSLSDDGTYVIAANTTTIVMPINGQTSSTLEVLRTGARDCYVAVRADTLEHAPMERPVGGMIQAGGRVDPKAPGVLAGSKTEESPAEGSGGKRVKTTTWQFRRQ